MTRVVIIGGGAAGLLAAYELGETARAGERITLVAERAELRSAPAGVAYDLAQNLERKGIGFTVAGARRVNPERNQLELGDGEVLDYEILLIAAGPRPAFDEIEGLGPDGHTQSLCEAEHLSGCAQAWKCLIADPGPVIVGAVQGASCFAPAYESALRMDAELRQRRIRARVRMTFVTSEPFIGDLGVGGVEDSRVRLEEALRSRDIASIVHARVDKVERGTLHVTELGAGGVPARSHALPFRYAMMMPPFRGIAAIAGIDGLANERGFILVDEFLRNPRYRNIYAAGATVAGTCAGQPGEHRSAYMIDGMVDTVARNIRAHIDGREPDSRPTWSHVHLADLGAAGLSFLAEPRAAFAPDEGIAASDWVHMSRCTACEVGEAARPVRLR